MKRIRQQNGGRLSFVQTIDSIFFGIRYGMYFKPDRTSGHPITNFRWRVRMTQFPLNGTGTITCSNRRGNSSMCPMRIR